MGKMSIVLVSAGKGEDNSTRVKTIPIKEVDLASSKQDYRIHKSLKKNVL